MTLLMLTPADLCGNGIKCKEIPIDPINETIVAFINSQKEASQYDFKQEWQKSGKDGDLLHTTGYDSFLRYMNEINHDSLKERILLASGLNELDKKTEMFINISFENEMIRVYFLTMRKYKDILS